MYSASSREYVFYALSTVVDRRSQTYASFRKGFLLLSSFILKLCPSAFTGCQNLHGVPFHAAIVVPFPGTGSIMTRLYTLERCATFPTNVFSLVTQPGIPVRGISHSHFFQQEAQSKDSPIPGILHSVLHPMQLNPVNDPEFNGQSILRQHDRYPVVHALQDREVTGSHPLSFLAKKTTRSSIRGYME